MDDKEYVVNPDGSRFQVTTNSKGQTIAKDAFGRDVIISEIFPVNKFECSV